MKSITCILALAAASGAASAGFIDWSGMPDWTPNTLGPYTYTGADGVDATVSVADPAGYTYDVYPDDGTNFGVSSLWIAGNFGSDPFGDVITITVEFSQAVTDVSFSTYDIDGSGGNLEQFTASAALGAGPAIGADGVAFGASISQADAFTFDSVGDFDADPPHERSQLDLTFSGPIDTLTLTFAGNSNNRGILIGDISYAPAPGSAALLGLAGLAATRRRR